MDQQPHPDRTLHLPRDAYYTAIHTLRGSLPAPVIDTPDDLARRDNAAIAKVAALLPANAAEAELAAQYVAACAQAMECLREARDPAMTLGFIVQCRGQAASMMRQSHGALRMLLRLQAVRQQREADATAAERAAWTEHCAVALMTQSLAGATDAAVDLPQAPPPAAPVPEPWPNRCPTRQPRPSSMR
jgi:hypothetical protein